MICSSVSKNTLRLTLSRRRTTLAATLALLCAAMYPGTTAAGLNVVTTTPGYAYLVEQIAGEHANVKSVMRGPEDIHNVVARPSHMMKLRRADLFIHSGLDAELWAPLLIKGARNRKLHPGQPGNVDVSRNIALKEVPSPAELSRAYGDIHVFGNVHYWLDPLNVIIIARTITDALQQADRNNVELYEHNFQTFARRMRDLTERLVESFKPYRGTKVVTYHRSWPYFLDRFGLAAVAEVEPRPGISPGPRHLRDCARIMEEQNARIVIVETYNSFKNAEFVAQRVNGRAVVLAQNVGALPQIDSFEKLFEYNVEQLIQAFTEAGVTPRAPASTSTPRDAQPAYSGASPARSEPNGAD